MTTARRYQIAIAKINDPDAPDSVYEAAERARRDLIAEIRGDEPLSPGTATMILTLNGKRYQVVCDESGNEMLIDTFVGRPALRVVA